MKKEIEVKTKGKEKTIVGTLGSRGRTFQGKVIKKFVNRVVVEFDRTVKIVKYERFAKKKTKLHARIPEGMDVAVGDYVQIRECRPLSKIIHFMVIQIVRRKDESSSS